MYVRMFSDCFWLSWLLHTIKQTINSSQTNICCYCNSLHSVQEQQPQPNRNNTCCNGIQVAASEMVSHHHSFIHPTSMIWVGGNVFQLPKVCKLLSYTIYIIRLNNLIFSDRSFGVPATTSKLKFKVQVRNRIMR